MSERDTEPVSEAFAFGATGWHWWLYRSLLGKGTTQQVADFLQAYS